LLAVRGPHVASRQNLSEGSWSKKVPLQHEQEAIVLCRTGAHRRRLVAAI